MKGRARSGVGWSGGGDGPRGAGGAGPVEPEGDGGQGGGHGDAGGDPGDRPGDDGPGVAQGAGVERPPRLGRDRLGHAGQQVPGGKGEGEGQQHPCRRRRAPWAPAGTPGGHQREQGEHGGQTQQRDRPGSGRDQRRHPAVDTGDGGRRVGVGGQPDDGPVVALGGTDAEGRAHVLESDQPQAAGRARGDQAAGPRLAEDQQRGGVGPPGSGPQPGDHDRPRTLGGLQAAGQVGKGGRVGDGQHQQLPRPQRDRPVTRPERPRRRGRPARPEREQPRRLQPGVGQHPGRGQPPEPRRRVVGPNPLHGARVRHPRGRRGIRLQGVHGIDPPSGGQRQHPRRQRLMHRQRRHEPSHLGPTRTGRGQRLVGRQPLHQHERARRGHLVRRDLSWRHLFRRDLGRRPGSPGARQGDHGHHQRHKQPTHPRIVAAACPPGRLWTTQRTPSATRLRSPTGARTSAAGGGARPGG